MTKANAGNCYFSIHAGSGGAENCAWAEMLMRMYLRYFEQRGYVCTEVDRMLGKEAGLRLVKLYVVGSGAYEHLSSEEGTHRLVRISPFDPKRRRCTSFATVYISPDPDELRGNIIRSYILDPYQLVRDERTGCESRRTDAILAGDIGQFVVGENPDATP